MSEGKHTAGPWILGKAFACHTQINGQDGMGVATTACNYQRGESGEDDANARLIASAPALLEALEAIYECGSIKEAERLAEAALKLAKEGL